MFGFRENKRLAAKLDAYLDCVDDALKVYRDAMHHYLENHIDEHFKAEVARCHQHEASADDLRREIEQLMYKKSLLPESRGDILRLIEQVDKIPNRCEKVLRRIYYQDVILPDALDETVGELVDLGVDTCLRFRRGVQDVLGECREIEALRREVDANESIGDDMEEDLIYRVFHGKYDRGDAILYRDIILWIADLLDQAENVADHLTILAIKRSA